jgi:hypothetical protein
MDDIEASLSTIRIFYAKLEQLRAMEGSELLLPGRTEPYRETLEDAYAAYGQLETTVDELGAELEYQHKRLDEGVRKDGAEEWKPERKPREKAKRGPVMMAMGKYIPLASKNGSRTGFPQSMPGYAHFLHRCGL